MPRAHVCCVRSVFVLALALVGPGYANGGGGAYMGRGLTSGLLNRFWGNRFGPYSEVIFAVVMGFVRTGDGHHRQQGATFAHADS